MILTEVGPFLLIIYIIIDVVLTVKISKAAARWGGSFSIYLVVGLLFSFIPIIISLICRIAINIQDQKETKKNQHSDTHYQEVDLSRIEQITSNDSQIKSVIICPNCKNKMHVNVKPEEFKKTRCTYCNKIITKNNVSFE